MTDIRPAWDPLQYSRFERERDRAAHDLLARLPEQLEAAEIWDLGCGAGQHAVALRRRWPEAKVHGLDSSEEMLTAARQSEADVEWRLGDIADWRPERPVDLIFANASLHWLSDHEALFRRLTATLAPGGVIAVQMPMAWETRHHALMREIAEQGSWAGALAGVETVAPLLEPEQYYAVLAEACEAVDVWSTSYLQALTGPDAVLEWMKGTALRPYLAVLTDPVMQAAFLDALGGRLSAAFPQRDDGVTLLPFPRLFLVARKR
ncbi:trans-aconitate 2-methyltransferase [Brevundimonas alba]|uniref:Trans-aconitate 2-methyltransferase n=1 Tax=Brevundimonas alba TaxID=74314 RepID=A0A7X6BPR4_9CAUL|nr:trans-aconitate 2-methyltransferase [Brevundimonas alba]